MEEIRFRSNNNHPGTRTQYASTPASNRKPASSTQSGSHRPATYQDQTTRVGTDATRIDRQPSIPKRAAKTMAKANSTGKTSRVNRWLFVLSITLLASWVVFAGFTFFSNNNPTLAQVNDPNNNSEQLALAIRDEVAKYLEDLPKETPKLDTVNDPAAGGVAFKDAAKGDKILYFESAGKAVIYRPSTGKVLVYTYSADSTNTTTGSESDAQNSDSSASNQDSTDSSESGSESSSPSPLLP